VLIAAVVKSPLLSVNAVTLALDAVWRFAGLPDDLGREWMQVAAEEAQHFALLSARMAAFGRAFGDIAAHDGLWEMACETRHDALARMALVPRELEARGLDAGPLVGERRLRAGDRESAAAIDVIRRDEIGHVAVGNRWVRQLCQIEGRDPAMIGSRARNDCGAPALRPPFNLEARRAAGLYADGLADLFAGRPSPDP